MTPDQIAGQIAAALPPLPDTRRLMVAIAGAPASGKSTIGAKLVEQLCASGQAAKLIPMDGFHLDDAILAQRGQSAHKGAPFTFDAAGFVALIERIRAGGEVFIPLFDRNRELAIAAADVIAPDTRIAVVEGNYLLLQENPWQNLRTLWDHAVLVDVPEPVIRARLEARWRAYGKADAAAWIETNDMPNACTVIARSARDGVQVISD